MARQLGAQTIAFERNIHILSTAATVGPKEGEGPLGQEFDVVLADMLAGESSWEAAESKIVERNMKLAIEKAGIRQEDVDYILAGDLLNQSIGATFGMRSLERPYYGLFSACATFGEALGLGAILIEAGGAKMVAAAASSHFCTAERQFRLPLEMGGQRPPTASWTVTGSGAAILGSDHAKPRITHITTGKIVDYGITDVNNMGAAMAPAAADTLRAHFADTGREPTDYDWIVTGDLGHYGRELVVRQLAEEGIALGSNFTDCGIKIYDQQMQDTHAGGSGCACAAVTFCGHYYRLLAQKKIKRMLLVPTGALLSTVSSQQGESIPGIAHAVAIECGI